MSRIISRALVWYFGDDSIAVEMHQELNPRLTIQEVKFWAEFPCKKRLLSGIMIVTDVLWLDPQHLSCFFPFKVYKERRLCKFCVLLPKRIILSPDSEPRASPWQTSYKYCSSTKRMVDSLLIKKWLYWLLIVFAMFSLDRKSIGASGARVILKKLWKGDRDCVTAVRLLSTSSCCCLWFNY